MLKKNLLIFMLISFVVQTTQASDYYMKYEQRACNKKGPHVDLGKYTLQNIKQGISDLNGKEHPDAQNCKNFNLTPQQVEMFFKEACVHDEVGFMHDVAGSPCYVEGVLVKNDGKKMSWIIHASAYGYINFGKADEVKLWCPQCNRPF